MNSYLYYDYYFEKISVMLLTFNFHENYFLTKRNEIIYIKRHTYEVGLKTLWILIIFKILKSMIFRKEILSVQKGANIS